MTYHTVGYETPFGVFFYENPPTLYTTPKGAQSKVNASRRNHTKEIKFKLIEVRITVVNEEDAKGNEA